MNKKISDLFAPRFSLYFICLAAFAVATALLGQIYLALAEGAVVLVLYAFFNRSESRRRRAVERYLEGLAGNVDVVARDTTLNCPLPVVMFRPDTDEVIWSNDRFLQISGTREHVFDTKMSAVAPGFDTRWLMEGKSCCPSEVALGARLFQVYGHLARTQGDRGRESFIATTYWLDVTDYAQTRDLYLSTKPVVSILLLDNYEDTIMSLDESVRSGLLNEVNRRLSAWTAGTGGLFCRLDRDRFLFIFEEQYLSAFTAEKFSILDQVHDIPTVGGVPVTLSVGVGQDADSISELFKYANLAIEMALSRGGDQAVVKNRFTFEFYGGRSKETEKRTKVKSRVMANALSSLISDSTCVFVMGHKFPDLDAVGAAVGVCAIARKNGIPAFIIKDPGSTPGDPMLNRLKDAPEYKERFISAQDALIMADSGALLVVVDTNRPEQVQSEELLLSCNKVAVIDHHRRAATYIEGAALNFHEPYASSASELVAELIQYIMEPAGMLKVEAEALLAGIVLDTKNFTMRTGGRTFEAAAFLRRSGADTAEVKKLFQNDLSGTIARYDIIQNAHMYHGDIAIAPVDHTVGRVTAAQAADELLNIAGISTSFVLFPDGERVILSARSMGDVNVQVIVEALGGGGNAATAGAQIPDKTVEQVTDLLVAAIDRYFEDE